MGYRRGSLAIGEVYHIYTKSIAGFKIFNSNSKYSRIKEAMIYYRVIKPVLRFSWLLRTNSEKASSIRDSLKEKDMLIDIIAYCIMPTHLHLILKQIKEHGISAFMNNILNSYTRYFNTKHKRKGPLWEGRFKSILIETDEQLLHLTRYIHLNPVTAHLVNKPEEWSASSYREYLGEVKDDEKICKYNDILDIEPFSYRKFVEDRISYQRELAAIKHLFGEGEI